MLDLSAIIAHHRDLDFLLASSPEHDNFISYWDGHHPFYQDAFRSGKLSVKNIQGYNYLRSDIELTQKVIAFHEYRDRICYQEKEVLLGAGSTAHILAFVTWLKIQEIKEVYYIAPLYFTFHYFFKIQGINLRPVSKQQPIEKNFSVNLPNKKSILLITDPVWYAGYAVPETMIRKIKEWQNLTGSLVFVDGSFQYLKWNKDQLELSTLLCKELTLRLICPTKAISTHGFRFAYLLLPKPYYNDFDFILDNAAGSSSAYDIGCSKICMDILNNPGSNQALTEYIHNIYRRLSVEQLIRTEIIPDCGYFIFAQLQKKVMRDFQAMDGKYFEQSKYKNYVRIN